MISCWSFPHKQSWRIRSYCQMSIIQPCSIKLCLSLILHNTWITSVRFWPHGFNITPPRNQCSSVAWKLWMADFSWPAFCCIKEKLLFWSPRSGLSYEPLIQTNSFIVETRFGFERLPAGRLHITDWHKRIKRPAPHLCEYYCTSRAHVLLSL